ISQISKKSLKDKDKKIEYVKFERYTILNFMSAIYNDKNEITSWQTNVISLTNDIANKYLDKCDEIGFFESFYNGYNGYVGIGIRKKKIKFQYIQMQNKTMVLRYEYNKLHFSFKLHSSFFVENNFFNFFIKNGGVDEKTNYGKYKYPIDSSGTTKKGTSYQDFYGGVIFKRNGKISGFNDIELKLIEIVGGKIYDPGGSSAPELFIKVWLDIERANKEKVVITKKERLPKEGSGGSNLKIDKTYILPKIHGGDKINLGVEAWDKDSKPKYDDHLVDYEFSFDLDSGFGIFDHTIIPNKEAYKDNESKTQMIYHGTHLTKIVDSGSFKGISNRNARIRLTFSLGRQQDESIDIDEYFRKNAYWSIDNFKATKPISNSTFDSLFGAQTSHWYDWILHPIDKIWYEIVKKNFSGTKGLCFGLSSEAMYSIHKCGTYKIPLYVWNFSLLPNHKPNQGNGVEHDNSDQVEQSFFGIIQKKHTYQGGWKHIKWVVNQFNAGRLNVPTKSFEHIKATMKKDSYCLVNLFGGGGHTVLAYKDGNDKIYVADSNSPWYKTDKLGKDTSYIKLTSSNVKKVELYENNNVMKTYSYCYATPWSIIANKPTVPSLFELLYFTTVTLLEFVFMGAAKNLYNFIAMIATGDAEFEFDCNKKIDIPIIDAQQQINSYPAVSIGAVMQKSQAKFQIKGKSKGSYMQFVICKNKIYTINSSTDKNEVDTIEFKNIYSAKPIITVNSSNKNKKISIDEQSIVKRYGLNSNNFRSDGKHKRRYYLNKRAQKNGDHEMHREDCKLLPYPINRIDLGRFGNEHEALEAAKKIYKKADGCSQCCRSVNSDKVY
ncbi:MAG: hypothetical protein II923_00460, partial [Campylobacter sp.]|nr:hypothetical protein [Campylobacter sp.]